ncbi:LGFP repeat-containing protein [Rhodococcus sp. NM-2]|uniref:LGFP repeat-containing protein n=1 Tax=Rhodococcus sp. NM-2 TaxID=3401174 RepID=UPI003AAAF0BE
MRSDREEVPAPFTKEDADKAEILEAQDLAKRSTSRAAVTCQRYWPSWFDVCGAIRDKYNSLGGPGSFLSYPSSGNIINPGNTGERVTFLNGPIYWSNATGAHPVVNSFLNRWGIHGYEAGWMGYPTTDEIVHTDGVGRHQEFSNGAIYVAFVNAIGSAIRNGPIRDKWNSLGAETGWLGYLTSDEFTLGTTRYHDFIGGRIYSTPSGGVQAVPWVESWKTNAAPDDDYCTRIKYESGDCYPSGDFAFVLDQMADCRYGDMPYDTYIIGLFDPTGNQPDLRMTCEVYDHISDRHLAHTDPENFLTCLMVTYGNGGPYSQVGDGYTGIRWTNLSTNVPGTIVYSLPTSEIVTAYAGPDDDEDEHGNNLGRVCERARPRST